MASQESASSRATIAFGRHQNTFVTKRLVGLHVAEVVRLPKSEVLRLPLFEDSSRVAALESLISGFVNIVSRFEKRLSRASLPSPPFRGEGSWREVRGNRPPTFEHKLVRMNAECELPLTPSLA